MSLKIYKRGNIWHYSGTVNQRRIRGSTRTTDKDRAQRIADEKGAREWQSRFEGPSSVLTFANATSLYLAAGKPKRFVLKVLDYWQDTPVKNITAGAIRASCSKLYPNVGPATWNRHVIAPTQAIINFAADHELCPPIRVKRFKTIKKEKEPATWRWVEQFMLHAGTPHLGALACFMFLTAARISEALSVEWLDIDMDACTVKIRQGKLGGDERVAHLPSPLVVALKNIEGRNGRVFKFKSRSNLKTQWEGAIRRAGIKRLTPHSCRHGFATSLLQAGYDVITVAKYGGWKSPALVLSTYGHAMLDQKLTDSLVGTKLTHKDTNMSNRSMKING
jgi:integrase